MEHERSRGDRYALTALRKKRATIAGEIVQLERQVRHRMDMLQHVDACLRILDPSIEVDAIPTGSLHSGSSCSGRASLGG